MWFKNATIFTFKPGCFPRLVDLEDALAEHPVRKCEPYEKKCAGWEKPLGPDSGNYVHIAGYYGLIMMKVTERVLPARVIKEHVNERVTAIQKKEQRKVGRKERANIEDEVTVELLRKAFQQSKTINGYLDATTKRLIIDTSSMVQAEEFAHFLCSAVDAMPTRIKTDSISSLKMTKWITTHCPEGFEALEDAILIDDENSKASLKHHILSGDEVLGHINHGKTVHELAMMWKNQVEFTLTSDLILKRIRFGDAVLKEADKIEIDNDDMAARFDADFSIMAEELSELVDNLIQIFSNPE